MSDEHGGNVAQFSYKQQVEAVRSINRRMAERASVPTSPTSSDLCSAIYRDDRIARLLRAGGFRPNSLDEAHFRAECEGHAAMAKQLRQAGASPARYEKSFGNTP